MAGPNVKKTILAYAGIAFILLGVLFGMNIMTFIFGSLGPDVAGLDQTAASVINESGAYVNITGYYLDSTSLPGAGGYAITAVWANVSGIAYLIPSTNYTLSSGVLRNATVVPNATAYNNANVSYTFSYDTGARLAVVNIQNDSLKSIQTYSNASGTQFSTISIAIILVILISLFLLFWTYFMGGGNKGERSSGNFT